MRLKKYFLSLYLPLIFFSHIRQVTIKRFNIFYDVFVGVLYCIFLFSMLNIVRFKERLNQGNHGGGGCICRSYSTNDTVNLRKLFQKCILAKGLRLTKFIGSILTNRLFYVTLQQRNSRWRTQRNRLLHLAPILYNIYTHLITNPSTPQWDVLYMQDTQLLPPKERLVQRLKITLTMLTKI